MKVRIGENDFVIKKMDSRLLLNVSEIPFSFFDVKVGKTIYEQMLKGKTDSKSAADLDLRVVKYVLSNGVELMNGSKFDVDLYLETSSDIIEAYVLIGQIIALTMPLFNARHDMQMDDVITIDVLAKRYAKTPIEIVSPKSDYSDWDAFLFNAFIANHAIKREVDAQKRALEQQRR